ncbi:D-lyxose/D-mannose family sugar isomerase [Lachnospiraceae bacterium C1.1]|nr:D-lyxose/D-mannose family sugar isomerase [Lachnospiraceae bacterium C1.1]
MKRSEINKIIKDMEELCKSCNFNLPFFSKWTADDIKKANEEYDEIFDNFLGWDITDFGLGDFYKYGMGLFTIRNGNIFMKDKYPKTYAEKIIAMYPGQRAQIHYHIAKMEDIINRGGNDISIKVWNGSKDFKLLDTDVTIHTDGRKYIVPAGSEIVLHPGDSITITPFLFHDFIVPETGGMTLIGEVSMCNDDNNDNYWFNRSVGRFSDVEEDEEIYRVLCNEYGKFRN